MNIDTLLCKLRVVCMVFRFRGFHGAVNHVIILRASTPSASIWVKYLCSKDVDTICMETSLSKHIFTRCQK
jgi:hypothetical protein